MSSLKSLAASWNVMWGISYIIVALVAPSISEIPSIIYALLGGAIIVFVAWTYISLDFTGRFFLSLTLFFLAGLEVYGGVTSWTGVFLWNIPFTNVEIFQVSMALADFISAAFFILLVIDIWEKGDRES